MRVSELADLTGTTPRTVRHYHRIGLLPVPADGPGPREYTLAHVARMTRIRWLVRAGVPLSAIRTLVEQPPTTAGAGADGNPDAVVADLRGVLAAVESELDRLAAQRDRLRELLVAASGGGDLSPMPPAVLRFYQRAEDRCDDEPARRLIREERSFTELAFYRGDMPREVEALFEGFDDHRLDRSLEDYRAVAERTTADGGRVVDPGEVAATAVQRLRQRLGADLPRVARGIDLAVARRAAELYVRLAPEPRRVERAVADAVLALLDEERRS